MKLFSSCVEGQNGRAKIKITPFVIAENRDDAQAKLEAYITSVPRLRNMVVKSAELTEEAAIF